MTNLRSATGNHPIQLITCYTVRIFYGKIYFNKKPQKTKQLSTGKATNSLRNFKHCPYVAPSN